MSENSQIPPTLTRQIGDQHWMAQIQNMIANDLYHALVSCHHDGWVYIIQRTNDNKFKCMTYKISVNPCKIKKELYNYTLTNGRLIYSNVSLPTFYN